MKKRLTITGVFNDTFTNYEDKESSVSFEVDTVKDCNCDKGGRCLLIHNRPENYKLTDI